MRNNPAPGALTGKRGGSFRGHMIEKPKREESPEFLAFIRTQLCCVCYRASLGPVDAHHVETRGAGGSDFTAIPLCRMHHAEIHTLGVRTFAKKHMINYSVLHAGLRDSFAMWVKP